MLLQASDIFMLYLPQKTADGSMALKYLVMSPAAGSCFATQRVETSSRRGEDLPDWVQREGILR